jgi:Domain of unknown function (DUF1883)
VLATTTLEDRVIAATTGLAGSAMSYLYWENTATAGDVVEVTLSGQANVKLMDAPNYSAYQSGRPYKFHGGLAKVSPLRLQVPYTGPWFVVVDLGGYSGQVRAAVRWLVAAR